MSIVVPKRAGMMGRRYFRKRQDLERRLYDRISRSYGPQSWKFSMDIDYGPDVALKENPQTVPGLPSAVKFRAQALVVMMNVSRAVSRLKLL